MKLYPLVRPLSQRLLLATIALATSACTTLPDFNGEDYVAPFEGAVVKENETRYTQSLQCLRNSAHTDSLGRFAVGKVADYTGKEDLTNGKRLTQGAALMVMSGLSKAGVKLVERFDTSVADIELKYADNKLITDQPGQGDYRRIFTGSLPGSDYHIIGGITEVNYNIRSGALESSIQFLSNSARYFVMNVALDLRLVNTKTLEIVNVQSLNKQIIGTELRGGFFRLFSDGLVDINASERTQEPIQRAVRMTIEQALFNMLNQSFKLKADDCQTILEPSTSLSEEVARPVAPTENPPLAQSEPIKAQPVQIQPVQAQPMDMSPPDENLTPANAKPIPILSQPWADSQEQQPSAMQNTPPEKTPEVMNGLVSNRESFQPDQSSRYKEKMKERLLWGDKPVIR